MKTCIRVCTCLAKYLSKRKIFGTKVKHVACFVHFICKPCQAIKPKERYSYISEVFNQREVASSVLLATCWLLAWLILQPWRCRWRSSESSVDFQHTTWRYTPEDRIFYNHRCKNLKSYIMKSWMTLDSVEIRCFVSLMQCSITVWYTKLFIGLFTFNFFRVCHSTERCAALFIQTTYA
jgi:hypothetical protein